MVLLCPIPNPLLLLCALFLCLPLAVIFTVTVTVTTTTAPNALGSTVLLSKPYASVSRQNHTQHPIIRQVEEEARLLDQMASKVNATVPSPNKKVAFMFITTTPLPFAPLWEFFFNQTGDNSTSSNRLFNVYVHADPTRTNEPPFSGVFSGRVIQSLPTRRNSPTLAAAARRLLAHALLDDPENCMFALLSPSCIPLRSLRFTHRTLTRSRRSFIEILDREPWAQGRWAARGEDAMLPEVPLEEFRVGSQFWAMTREHARVVVGDREIWPKFDRACVNLGACYPEENYFSTLVHMRDPRGTVAATLTHVDWRGSRGGHPRTYTASEVGPALIMHLREATPRYGDDGGGGNGSDAKRRRYPFLFARKFSGDSIGPLMSIAKDVILKD